MTDQQSSIKTALVTGCSSGIGYSLALELASRGYKVFACARRVELMKPLKEKFPDNIITFKMDVSSLDSIQQGYELVKGELSKYSEIPKLDLLYNNSGQPCTFPAIDVPDDALTGCLNVNVVGPVRVTKTFVDLVINAKGTIAFTSSIAGVAQIPLPWCSIYSASKAALSAYASTLQFELEPLECKVLNVIAGSVKTAFSDSRQIPKDSIYLSTKEGVESFEYRKKMVSESFEKSMDPDAFAKSVVSQIENANKRTLNLYEGTMSWLAPFVNKYIPRFIILAGFRTKFMLGPVWNSIRKKYSGTRKTD